MEQLVTKRALDQRIASLMGKKTVEISGITEMFLYEIAQALLNDDAVRLDGLGTMHVVVRHGKRASMAVLTKGTFHKGERGETTTVSVEKKYYVVFKKAVKFADSMRLQRQAKEKKPWRSTA